MGGISSLLYIGAGGLSASQHAVQTASDNITNVSTPGYRRREAVHSTAPSYFRGGQPFGGGVQIDGTRRMVDGVLARRARAAYSESAFSQAQSSALRQAEALFGELSGQQIGARLDEVFAAFDQLANAPQDAGARRRTLEAAGAWSESLNFVSGALRSLQRELDRQVDSDVDHVNRLSGQIAELNDKISSAPVPPPDLLDRRDQALSELANLVSISVVETGNQVQVSLQGSGYGLVIDGRTNSLSASTVSGRVVVSGQRFGQPVDLTDSLHGGQLAGTVEARNVDIEDVIGALDEFTFEVASAINASHRAGFGADGVGGRDLFSIPPTATDAAGAIGLAADLVDRPDRLAAASDPTLVPGDNRNAVVLAELRSSALPSGEPPAEMLNTVLTDFGAKIASSASTAEAKAGVAEHLDDLHSQVSAVNLDEEMTRLLQYRQAYAAAARVIQTADELMQQVVALKR